MKRYLLIALSLIALVIIYLFQRFSFAGAFNALMPESMAIVNPHTIFVINKTVRLILNDMACMVLIYSWFENKLYLRAAFFLFLGELFILLPLYLIIKLNLEGASELSSPLLSQIHRLIVNPLLMFLLMLGFVYQRLKSEKS
jgi:exosortase F-associated protein